MSGSVDVVAELARRERLARRALLLGAVCFLLLLAGSFFSSRFSSSAWAPLLWTSNLFSFLISPVALGTGIANLSTSDSHLLRFVYGFITAAVVLVALTILSFNVYVAGGGKFHI